MHFTFSTILMFLHNIINILNLGIIQVFYCTSFRTIVSVPYQCLVNFHIHPCYGEFYRNLQVKRIVSPRCFLNLLPSYEFFFIFLIYLLKLYKMEEKIADWHFQTGDMAGKCFWLWSDKIVSIDLIYRILLDQCKHKCTYYWDTEEIHLNCPL